MNYISSLSYEPGLPIEWEGLDYESAKDATPRLYAVSYGDGNNGVSHTYYDFSCRTTDSYVLARLAMITAMKDKSQRWASRNVEVDGEADYTISAMLYDPPGKDGAGWSDVKGAWLIAEVFLLDADDIRDKPSYDNLIECFGKDTVAKYSE